MENKTTLTFDIYVDTDQRSTLMHLYAMTKAIVFEAILHQRGALRLYQPNGQVKDFGHFDRLHFLDEFMEDKGFIKPFDQLHASLLLGAVKIAEDIISQPEHTDKETKKKIPGLYQFATKGGVCFALNAKVNDQDVSPQFSFRPIEVRQQKDNLFLPACHFEFPHLGEIPAHIQSKALTTYAVNDILSDYIPAYGRFIEVNQSTKNDNLWSLEVTFIRKEDFVPISAKLPHLNLDVESVSFPTAYGLRKKRLGKAIFRDHTSCRSDPLSLK